MWIRPGWPRPGWLSRCAPGGPSNDKNRETLGRSRGGLTSKIHLLAEMGCRPLARITSAGQRDDSLAFLPLMNQLAITRPGGGSPRTRPGRVLGDKAYSSTAIRAHLRRRGIKATIPQRSDQVRGRRRHGRRGGRPPAFDPRRLQGPQRLERQVDPEGSLPPEERAALVRSAGRQLGAALNAARARKRRPTTDG